MTVKGQTESKGQWLLRHPIMPIVRIVRFLFFTGEFKTIDEILDQLVEPIEMDKVVYDDPRAALEQYLPIIRAYEAVKSREKKAPVPLIYDEDSQQVSQLKALELWVDQQVLTLELERINSLLCEPCGCVLCCVGPEADTGDATEKTAMKQHFFEIPLSDKEVDIFDLPGIDNEETRAMIAMSEPCLMVDGAPFYEAGTAIYRWHNGWSMILPRDTVCPQLNDDKRCNIYSRRPEVCRRPQIFPYVIERQADMDLHADNIKVLAYIARKKMLAIWDCPYVRELKEDIANYAQLSGLEPVFKENKG